MFADGGENLIHYPRLEAGGGGQLGANNQAVEIALGDKTTPHDLLRILRMRCVAFHDRPAMPQNSVTRIGISEYRRAFHR